MKLMKFLIAIIFITAVVRGVLKIKKNLSSIPDTDDITEGFNNIIGNMVDTGAIQNSLSGKLDEAKGIAGQYYDEVLKDYVDKAKEGISGAVENAKGYYNQGIDEIGNTITNEINSKVTEGLDKIKVK